MIGSALLGKAGLIGVLIAIGGVGGMFLQQKVFAPRPHKIDYNEIRKIFSEEIKNLPAPTVAIQPFDVEQIKKVREFNYSPQFSGSVQVTGVDSTGVKRYIENAVMKAFEKHITPDKKRRR